ncbi:MAG: phytoene/squalene synthase family protein [Bacteriovorax sp.]|nr:phytoene/squalene synthase family protein [Bacteriovorax sp.]
MDLRQRKISPTMPKELFLNNLTFDQLTEEYFKVDAKDLMAKHGKSFYFASCIFKESDLEKIATLYRLCRFIDDCADELPPAESARAMASIFDDLNHPHNQTSFNLLMAEVEAFGVQRWQIKELLIGAQFDVQGGQILTQKDLMLYCFRVAGVVGLMMCPLIGVTSPKAYAHSIDLGLGMQLTNICRDISEDADNNRSYLPNLNSMAPEDIKNLVRETLDMADRYYFSAYDGLSYIPIRPRIVILLAGELYRHIGIKIRRNHYDITGGRTYLKLWEKILVSIKCLFKLGQSFFWKSKGHHSSLHFPIQDHIQGYTQGNIG